MTESFGPGVSRTLSALARQFGAVVFLKSKPPLDATMNLVSQVEIDKIRQVVQLNCHSGFFCDPTRSLDDYVCSPLGSNLFQFGQQKLDENGRPEELAPVLFANVAGWIIPVTGTDQETEGITSNLVRLYPPPDTGSRVDFVFLEAWEALIQPTPSTQNKPSSSTLWKYGNVEFGQTNLPDDLKDPNIVYETDRRTQIQYRIRVVGYGPGTSPSFEEYPDGLDDPVVKAQGPLATPSTWSFANMRTELGDPGLWRAGDGDPNNTLKTVDGYVYAIPICGVFRRNSSPYVAAKLAGGPNQNGAFNRNPSAATLPDPRDGAKYLTVMSLVNDLPPGQFTLDTLIQVDNLVGSGFDDPNLDLTKTFLVIDHEIMSISTVDTVPSPPTITIPAGGRARYGTDAVFHAGRKDPLTAGTGTPIQFWNSRPDGKFADEINADDIYDRRHAVNFGDWDFTRILTHNVAALMRGRLRSTWKAAGAPGGDTEGVSVEEVDYLLADGGTPVPLGTEAMDGPDGIRQVFSDSAALQGDVTLLLDNDGTMNAGFIQTLDDLVSWDVGADFKPSGFLNNLNNTNPGWTNGSTIFLHIGGDSGSEGARKTFRDGSTRAVRFVSPYEYWKQNTLDKSIGLQTPVTLRWISTVQANAGVQAAGAGLQSLLPPGPNELSVQHPGSMYPLQLLDFEKPFLVLGGILNAVLAVTGISGATQLIGNSLDPLIPLGEGEIVFPGFNFDIPGDWWSQDANGQFETNPNLVNFPLLRAQRTLYDMLTVGGRDITGSSSQVYLILFGDDETTANNGAFKVIGAGTIGLTTKNASASNRVRVQFITQGVQDFDNATTKSVTAQVRSQFTNSEDGPGAALGPASLTVTLTDIEALEGGQSNPWNETNINSTLLPGKTLQQPFNYKCILSCMLQYHPGRGAMARVGDKIHEVAIQSPASKILRQSGVNLDPVFPSQSGIPATPVEVLFDPVQLQTWNRLPSLGLPENKAPNYGGNVVLFSEEDRENEAFFDIGSKTLVFRPQQRQEMTIQGVTTNNTPQTLLGPSSYPFPSLIPNGWDGPKDDAQVFTTGLQGAYVVPSEYMPRFGRQDIPYYQDSAPYGSGPFLEGINHLFYDGTNLTNPVFYIIGGDDNQSGGTLVTRFLFQTGTTSGLKYGQYGTITGVPSQAYQARLLSEIGTVTPFASEITARIKKIVSSDFGAGLNGIQLPPYLGLARVYGVYDRRDFVAKGGFTYQSDRVTPEANPAVNLLRRDQTKQSLFILQDGAKDLTGEANDHTYVIPSNDLDITKSPAYTAGEKFEDLEYVVECTIFGFARGFINQNNFALARRHNAQGTLIADGDNPELEGALMVIPSAAPDGARAYVSYERTVYQGDPYMTRAGETRTVTDYEERYGQISNSDAFELATPIQQYDASGNLIPQRPNARAFQVLASMDFYTTLGTGKMGGRLFPGTVTDVGFTEANAQTSTRIPDSATEPAYRVLTRTFTEGQRKNSSRALAILEILGDNATFVFLPSPLATTVSISTVEGTLAKFSAFNGPTAAQDEFDASSPDPAVIAREIFEKINARTSLRNTLLAYNDIDSPQIELVAKPVGAEGNTIRVSINDIVNLQLNVSKSGDEGLDATVTSAYLTGGEDLPVNGGKGTSQLDLTGMTERLPLGILLNDSDFLGENPLGDNASAVQTVMGGIRPIQNLLPLTQSGGEEFTRFTGGPGELLGMSDGAILQYGAFTDSNPGGTKRFRLYRGGGSVFVLSGQNPGGPVDWVSDSLPAALRPVLKGGLLACKALLIRNFEEKAFAVESEVTPGDEIQMVIITQGILGDGASAQEGITLDGIISPTGYGEGLAAADRYACMGRPLLQGRVRTTPDPATVPLAIFPGREEI